MIITRSRHASKLSRSHFDLRSRKILEEKQYQVRKGQCDLCALIQILDYGSGNLFSISNSLEKVSARCAVRISPKYDAGEIDGLILPGVGSFASAQKVLGDSRDQILNDVKKEKMPILGICLGMQLMFEKSQEGEGQGLGLFSGDIVRFKSERGLKVPHMGWNKVSLIVPLSDSGLLADLKPKDWGYFAHSYYPRPEDKQIVLGKTGYGGRTFSSIVQKENVCGTQYHPEKSGEFGLQLISNFAKLVSSYSKR
jgi:imidazole glycerol-phosphate synthase subunit HisH